jgi:hypothetical protein
MSDLTYPLVLQQRLAAWSDQAQKKAAHFADAHRDLYPRRITNAQLYGLANVSRNARRFEDIKRFMEHQGKKAERAGRLDVRDYWTDLIKALSDLQAEARQLGIETKTELDKLHREMAVEFIQHLVAHSSYWTPSSGDKGERRSR